MDVKGRGTNEQDNGRMVTLVTPPTRCSTTVVVAPQTVRTSSYPKGPEPRCMHVTSGQAATLRCMHACMHCIAGKRAMHANGPVGRRTRLTAEWRLGCGGGTAVRRQAAARGSGVQRPQRMHPCRHQRPAATKKTKEKKNKGRCRRRNLRACSADVGGAASPGGSSGPAASGQPGQPAPATDRHGHGHTHHPR